MSSVTRFLKQFDVSQSYLSVPTDLTLLYEFVPSGTVTGNYPAGAVQAVSGVVATEIVRQSAISGGRLILRDMGKTITANIFGATTLGRYRQVQLLAPRDLNATNNTFGVIGVPAGSDPLKTNANVSYYTLYIPVPVAGVLSANLLTGVTALAGGQM
jgi:hypothetical protein